MSRTPASRSRFGSGNMPHSGIPGAPSGPAFRSTSTSSAVIASAGSSSRAFMSAGDSNTTARPVCTSSRGSAAVGLITQPSGARLPRSTKVPPAAETGSPRGRITRSSSTSAPAMLSPSERPVTVSASVWSRSRSRSSTAGRPPASCRSSARYSPDGRMLAITGVRREISSNRSSGRETPARPASAIRWTIALVEPAIAMSAAIALSNEAGERIREGLRSSQTISTIRRPQAAAIRSWAEWTAGMVEAPGSISPRASVTAAMVTAVPIVMQVPGVRAMPSSMPRQAHSERQPACRSAQNFQTSVPLPSRWSRQRPASIGPAGMKIAGRSAVIAPIRRPGTVLSQPPISTAPSTGWHRSTSSASSASRLR